MTTEEQTKHNIRLTSAEIANLWNSYMNDSMAICVLKYFLEKVEDTEVRPVLEYAFELVNNHIDRVTKILNHENHPIPLGFTDEDVNVTAPRLYSDTFYLIYIQNMSRAGLTAYSLALPLVTRTDVVDFYHECLASSAELNMKTSKVMLSKGVYTRAPYISIPEKVDFIQKQSYLESWLEGSRPLDSLELTSIYMCLLTNILGRALLMGFSQVAKSQQVKEYLARGTKIGSKHIEVFGSLLTESHLSTPQTWDSEVMDSTVAPFSEKLMMFHTRVLSLAGIANYGTSIAASMRHDLGVTYGRLTAEMGLYGDDGANIMINNGWMEQPPQADDRKELAGV